MELACQIFINFDDCLQLYSFHVFKFVICEIVSAKINRLYHMYP